MPALREQPRVLTNFRPEQVPESCRYCLAMTRAMGPWPVPRIAVVRALSPYELSCNMREVANASNQHYDYNKQLEQP